MDTLQKNGYDLAKAMSTLVPQGGPVLCRDEMEEWSASEAMLFEEALEKYGKDFNDIRQDFVSLQHHNWPFALTQTALFGKVQTILMCICCWTAVALEVIS